MNINSGWGIFSAVICRNCMKKLVVFDLDGTLLNTIADLSASVNYALLQNGFPARTEEECRTFVGNGIDKLLERALPSGYQTPANVARLKPVFLAHYDQHNTDLTTPYPGVEELVERLQKRDIGLAVLSNKYQLAAEKVVKHYFPTVSFVAVIGQRSGVPTKPNPVGVYEIMRLAGVKKEEVLYVGDSDVDVLTAQNAGVACCAVSWGFRSRVQLEALAPDFIVYAPLEIITLIK